MPNIAANDRQMPRKIGYGLWIGYALAGGLATAVSADDGRLPPEVEAFIRERDLCEHFRGEPYAGDTPAEIERRQFIEDSLDIYCAGSDRRLAALKRRYKETAEVLARLKQYEDNIEPPCRQ